MGSRVCRKTMHLLNLSVAVSKLQVAIRVSTVRILYAKKLKKNTQQLSRKPSPAQVYEPASDPSKRGTNAVHGRSIASNQPKRQQHERQQLRSQRRQIERKQRKATSQNADNESFQLHGLTIWFRNYYVLCFPEKCILIYFRIGLRGAEHG